MIKNKDKKLNNYPGAIHIHSVHSDGTGGIEGICRAAKKAGLDWIIITDHNNSDIEEGFFDGICVIKGEEISPENSNHYLALDINKVVSEKLPPRDFIQEVRAQGGFGFAAHPDESDARKNSTKPIKWLDKTIRPDGVEIWNWFSEWGDNYSSINIFTLAYAYLFKHKLIHKPNEETLHWWDELNNESENIVPAIGGVDAHALKIGKYIIPVTIFPYEDMFRTITNIVYLDEKLCNNFQTAKEQILNAVKSGKNLIVNRKVYKEIPEINITNSNTEAQTGESINLDDNTFINIRLGRMFEVKILRNGEVFWKKYTKTSKVPVTANGKYRVEIELNRRGYAYSNPITVKG